MDLSNSNRWPKARPVLGWAVVGASFTALQLYVYTTWIAAGGLHPVPATGPSVLPTMTTIWMWATQIGVMGLTAWWLARGVRAWRLQGRLSPDVILGIASLSLAWQDSMVNYFRTGFLYNSYLINVSSWDGHIPGWVSPNPAQLPQPLFVSGFGYLLNVPMALIILAILVHASRRFPELGRVRLGVLAWISGAILNFALEATWVQGGLYAYSGCLPVGTLWLGETFQFPAYESALIGGMWAAIALLRFFGDVHGTAIERGIERIEASAFRTALRTLAWIGFLNTFFLTYNLVLMLASFHVAPTPDGYPSYLLNGICGAGTSDPCAGPGIPVATP